MLVIRDDKSKASFQKTSKESKLVYETEGERNGWVLTAENFQLLSA